MTLRFHTASLERAGILAEPDLFDISRGSGGDRGAPFAPSWQLLRPAIEKMRQGGAVAEEAWTAYVPAFLREMAISQSWFDEAWAALLSAEYRIIACHCRSRRRCHRDLVAGLLVARGAVDLGELPPRRRLAARVAR